MRIWKYQLNVIDEQQLFLPADAKILTVQTQRGTPCLWALVNEENTAKELRKIAIYGTGNPIPDDPGEYIATFQMHGGDLVFHVFEVK